MVQRDCDKNDGTGCPNGAIRFCQNVANKQSEVCDHHATAKRKFKDFMALARELGGSITSESKQNNRENDRKSHRKFSRKIPIALARIEMAMISLISNLVSLDTACSNIVKCNYFVNGDLIEND